MRPSGSSAVGATPPSRELGTSPGVAVLLALRERPGREQEADAAAIHATTEAGTAAVAAGALRVGVDSFETAVRLADRGAGAEPARRDPAGARRGPHPHARRPRRGGRGQPDRGRAHRRSRTVTREAAALARAELGYVDFLRARYDRAERWLLQVLAATEVPVDPGEGDDLPGLGRQRPRRLPARRTPPRGGRPRCPARWASHGARPSGSPCWAGSACCAASSTRRPASSPPRWSSGERRPLAVVPAVATGAARAGADLAG